MSSEQYIEWTTVQSTWINQYTQYGDLPQKLAVAFFDPIKLFAKNAIPLYKGKLLIIVRTTTTKNRCIILE